MSAPAGWYPDPTRRHGERYWAGAHWTEYVRDRGVAGVDPLEVVAHQAEAEAGKTSYSETSRAEAAPQGWYPAPGVPGEERYWDGVHWTHYTRPARTAPTQDAVGATAAVRTNAKAVASLTLALVWLGGIASLLAILFGLLARREIVRSFGAERGAGLASAGIVVGLFGLLLAGLVAAAFVVLFLLARQ